MLPAVEHAAEELCTLGVASDGEVAPVVQQATGTAHDTLRAIDDAVRSIRKLHMEAMTVRGLLCPLPLAAASLCFWGVQSQQFGGLSVGPQQRRMITIPKLHCGCSLRDDLQRSRLLSEVLTQRERFQAWLLTPGFQDDESFVSC